MYWHRRLPHWVPEDSVVFVTCCLAESNPSSDAGPNWLADSRIAAIFVEALLHGENVRRAYDLFAWAAMPDHVHMVIQPIRPLHEIMRWLKAATANRANLLLGRTGNPFWQREYFDRWIRTEKQLGDVIGYVEDNPVRSGLATCAEEWQWSGAFETPAARPPALQTERDGR